MKSEEDDDEEEEQELPYLLFLIFFVDIFEIWAGLSSGPSMFDNYGWGLGLFIRVQ